MTILGWIKRVERYKKGIERNEKKDANERLKILMFWGRILTRYLISCKVRNVYFENNRFNPQKWNHKIFIFSKKYFSNTCKNVYDDQMDKS